MIVGKKGETRVVDLVGLLSTAQITSEKRERKKEEKKKEEGGKKREIIVF